MTVKSNEVPAFQPNKTKQSKNQSHLVRAIVCRALNKLQVIARNSDWFIVLLSHVVIARCNSSGVGFSTVI